MIDLQAIDPRAIRDRLDRVGRWSLGLGGAAAVVCALAAVAWPSAVVRAYLPAFLFAWGLSIGCLGLGLLYRMTGGRWGRAGLPFIESGLRLVPATALLFLPVAVGLAAVYPWTDPHFFDGFEGVAHRRMYLTTGFFLLRAAGYFVLWSVLAFAAARGWAVSGLSMVLLVVSVTWAVMDWGMSIDPWFASSIWGALIGAGCGMSALAAVCVGVAALPGNPTLPPDAPKEALGDLGSLLLAFVMLWTYMAFSQFLIIWSGNLPDEADWYVRRSVGGWQWLIILIALGGFALPFAALLSRDLKRKPALLAAVAGLVLVMNYLLLCWHVLPEYSPGRFWFNPFAVVTPLATGGLWFAALVRLARGRPELAVAEETAGGAP
jgi:hypothetical protein